MSSRCEHCGKKHHPTWVSAIHAALRNSGLFGRAFRVYRCPRGNGFHLTTKPARWGP